MFIVEQQAPTQTDIVNSIGLSASSVNWHMRRLIDFRLVEEIKEGKYRRYQLRNRKVSSKYITALMRNYYPALWEKWSDRLIDIFLSISRGETKQ
jgi:DNA-binding transcriptional ArsR family regulator